MTVFVSAVFVVEESYSEFIKQGNALHSNNKNKNLYFVNAEAKAWFEEQGYNFKWLYDQDANISSASGLKISNSNKVGDYITLNNTGLPVTYTRTAAEQAALQINTLYTTAISDVHAKILGLTGYTCGDLFYQRTLLDGAEKALQQLLEQTGVDIPQ